MSTLKTIVIADEATGEVLETLFTDEDLDAIVNTLCGDEPCGISFFGSKESYDKANNS